jgi:hypothetical protein
MWLALAVILLILWALGAFALKVASALIHILIVLAVLAVIWHFVAGTRRRL